ncbi:hypothetical protein [Nostoc sp.]|uniref:hypothetical protein n=1 Tax=Nostoc sp. TaxID=1180 RepID=UPI002FF8A0B1
MQYKWIVSLVVLPLLTVSCIYAVRGQSTPQVVQPGKPVLTVGSEIPVTISLLAEKVLQGRDGVQFLPMNPPDNLPVSATEALELANKTTLSLLTRKPIRTTVEFMNYTDASRGMQNRMVWKVTYWGAPIVMVGPASSTNLSQPKVQQPNSQRAITYVLIDPLAPNPKDDFISRVSAGPTSD